MAIIIIEVVALQIKAKVLSSSTFLFQKFALPNTHFYDMAGIYLLHLGKAELKDLLFELREGTAMRRAYSLIFPLQSMNREEVNS